MRTATDELAATMSERELQQNVRDAAKKLGWTDYCWWSSLHSPKGWPDLVLLREEAELVLDTGHRDFYNQTAKLIAIELKSEKGKLSPEQVECHRLLRLAQIDVYVFRPSDWFTGEIDKVLV